MNSYEMAEDYLKRAGRCLNEAEGSLQDEDYAMTIRRSQECIEPAIKGILSAVFFEFPREHDVSDVLMHVEWREFGLPDWFVKQVEMLAQIMREITPKRGPAMYGFEREMRPAGTLFSQEDGLKAKEDARFVYEACRQFLDQWDVK
jgi:HEPN domain-containing protein